MIERICICGAGTMGSGIAQTAAQHGLYTILFDLSKEILDKAKTSIQKNLETLASKNKISAEEVTSIYSRIQFVNDTNYCIADVIIEAIIEKAEAKIALFNQLAEINHSEVIFASNTSSLSITTIQNKIMHPSRVAGMHFFNPAPVMKLVEVIKGEQTSTEVIESIIELSKQMGKVPVICKDSPGFIVNRVARHYYLEAMKIVEQGIASPEEVDKAMEESRFKMGPFKLMDLIGLDINLSVTESIYDALHHERFKPSNLQKDKVKNGELGRKTGKGFYAY